MGAVSDFQSLTKEYFWFLVRDRGFTYDEHRNSFANDEIEITVSDMDRLIPIVEIWVKSEPLFTRLSLPSYASNTKPKNSLKGNFDYYAGVLRGLFPEVATTPESLLLPALKRFFEQLCDMQNLEAGEFLRRNGYYRRLFEYICEHDPSWKLGLKK